MKTAHIQGKDSRNVTRYATIIEKSEGKFTISISNPRCYSSASNFQIKSLANKVIAANLQHEAVIQLIDSGVTNKSKLVILLQEHSQDLKITFLEMTKEWATKNFTKAEKLSKRTYKDWLIAYDVLDYPQSDKTNISAFYRSPEQKEFNKRKNQMESTISEVNRMIKLGQEGYLEKELAAAERHYNDSIIKLASRLKNKGVDENTDLDITSGRVGVNFECIIKHNGKITRAYTIVASGEIQQPHYRYLVK